MKNQKAAPPCTHYTLVAFQSDAICKIITSIFLRQYNTFTLKGNFIRGKLNENKSLTETSLNSSMP